MFKCHAMTRRNTSSKTWLWSLQARLAILVFSHCGIAIPAALAETREWRFEGIADAKAAEFVAIGGGHVVLRSPGGAAMEVPIQAFQRADQQALRMLATAGESPAPESLPVGEPVTRARAINVQRLAAVESRVLESGQPGEIRITAGEKAMPGGWINLTRGDSWVCFENIPPQGVWDQYLSRIFVAGRPAEPGKNVRILAHGRGTWIIPHGPGQSALVLHAGPRRQGAVVELAANADHDAGALSGLGAPPSSLVLRRGFMATLAARRDGTGPSVNLVAQDHDVVLEAMPEGLDQGVEFIRIFPWNWTTKKGIAGNIHEPLHVSWFYNWNINQMSTAEIEYVPIKQKRHWPGLGRDWRGMGATHLLGFNEPDRPDQANMSVEDAIRAWPELMATGLRLGSPAPADSGLSWLYQFIDRADAEGLRVDFVAVHYYRAVQNPRDARGAADQLERFLKQIHDRVKRPLWVTEWNNGANWTREPKPNPAQQQAAVRAMIEMMDKAPFVERYALYNWVENERMLVAGDGSLTPAGIWFRDHHSPTAYSQK